MLPSKLFFILLLIGSCLTKKHSRRPSITTRTSIPRHRWTTDKLVMSSEESSTTEENLFLGEIYTTAEYSPSDEDTTEHVIQDDSSAAPTQEPTIKGEIYTTAEFSPSDEVTTEHVIQYDSSAAPTQEPTIKESLLICESSLHNKEDLQTIIDYITSHININNEDLYKRVENIRDDMLEDIEEFRSWFLGQPEHLIHVLEELERNKYKLEPFLDGISKSFDMLSNLKEEFHLRDISAYQAFQSFNKYNQICSLNCGEEIIVETAKSFGNSMSYNPKEYYCGSISNVYNDVTNHVMGFIKQLQSEMERRLYNDALEYSHKIEIVKNEFKDMALKEFGRTMYDILNLHDEYTHLEKIIHQSDVKSSFIIVRQTLAQLYPNLLTLEAAVEKYGKYCRVCGHRPISRNLKDSHEEISINGLETYSILEEQISVKTNEIREIVQKQYSELLMPLDKKLKEADNPKEYLKELQHLQEKIVTETALQNTNLEHLKMKIPHVSYYHTLSQLEKESINLLSTVQKFIQHLSSKISSYY